MTPNLQPLIFTVDDDKFYLKLIEQQLKHAGYTRLYTFTTGEECVDNLHLMPDIILLDYNLRNTNGIEVLKKIKIYHQDAYIFFLSAQEEIDIAINSIKHGAFGYVVKDELALSNILEEIKGIVSYQAVVEAEERKSANFHPVGLTSYKAELEQREKILMNKNEQLTKLNGELDKFVYSTSHNLRGPLTSMMGLIKLAQIEEESFHKDTFLQLMEKMVNKLDFTLKDIIDHSANTRTAITVEEVNVQEIIDNIYESLTYLEGASYISKQLSIDQEALLFSDVHRLKIIFYNLLSNAIQYHDFSKSLPFIAIRILVKKDLVRINVIDNGSGVNEAYIEKMFDMFSRGTSKSNGSGLGLYIVKETINKLKGTIEVTSKPGEGTAFYIDLPNHNNY
jgi:signal transduction histidine kinase